MNTAEIIPFDNPRDRRTDQPAPSGPLTMTTEELAHELRVDDRTIRRWDKTGKLPKPIRIGGSKRWSRDVIQRWLAAVKPDGTLPNRREWEAIEEQRIRNEIARR